MPTVNQARIGELVVGGSRSNWANIGIHVSATGKCFIGEVALRIDELLPSGMHSWSLKNVSQTIHSIDGIATCVHIDNVDNVDDVGIETEPASKFFLHPLSIDHVVVNTPNLERTSQAITQATGAELKRIRDAGNGMRQGFHRLGEVVVEVVSAPTMPPADASLWGFVINVANVHDAATFLGPDVLSEPKPAVQPQRLISTFRSAAGLGVPVALMSDC